jgi:hypothetical protein
MQYKVGIIKPRWFQVDNTTTCYGTTHFFLLTHFSHSLWSKNCSIQQQKTVHPGLDMLCRYFPTPISFSASLVSSHRMTGHVDGTHLFTIHAQLPAYAA